MEANTSTPTSGMWVKIKRSRYVHCLKERRTSQATNKQYYSTYCGNIVVWPHELIELDPDQDAPNCSQCTRLAPKPEAQAIHSAVFDPV